MSVAFKNFLTGRGDGTIQRSYAHATQLYVTDSYARAPKLGFIYFVSFTINPAAIKDGNWKSNYADTVGLLAKKVDMPKFKISTETINQYNRKTNIQTKITYEPVNFEFHDDNSEITNGLWKNYYKYYYTDSNYGDPGSLTGSFDDSKYKQTDYNYGLSNGQQDPFFKEINIYVLHQRRFTQFTLVNPLVTSWDHDSLDQTNGTKILQNKMSIAYENVFYYQGAIEDGEAESQFKAVYYDNDVSPLALGSAVGNNVQGAEALFSKPQPAPHPVPQYASPVPPGYSLSQLNKNAMQAGPSYVMPRPMGAGTVGLGMQGQRPGGFGISGLSLWYGYGGIHGRAIIQAGPIRLAVKR